jgi:hypothetical protein
VERVLQLVLRLQHQHLPTFLPGDDRQPTFSHTQMLVAIRCIRPSRVANRRR